MQLAQVIRKRAMCRSYEDRPVPREVLDRIMDLAVRFPSAGHTQPQEFILVTQQDTKDRLAEAALDQRYLAAAPVVIAVVSDTRRSAARYGERGERFYSIVDGAFASMLVMLAAIDQGLGAGFVGAFDDDAVREVLGLPPPVRPIGLIPIGYCAERPSRLTRRKKEEIIHRERWQD